MRQERDNEDQDDSAEPGHVLGTIRRHWSAVGFAMSDDLPRTTLAAGYVCVHVWCKACKHRANADLDRLVAEVVVV